MKADFETLVIGAGISGLAYAQRLGVESCMVLEAAEHPGGLIRTSVEPGGLRHEWGPETISDAEGSALALVNELELGIQRAPAEASKRFLALGGVLREIPMKPPQLLLGDLLPLCARLRLFSEPFRSAAKGLDGSIAEFFLHRAGRHVLETLVDPMLGGIHGAAPEELSMRACFPQIVRGVEQHGSLFAYLRARSKAAAGKPPGGPWKPAGGMGRLPAKLAELLGPRLRLGTRVDAIEATRHGWRASCGKESFEARRLVLALPQASCAKLLAGILPKLAGSMLVAPRESLCVHVSAHRREDVAHALDGFGYLVPSSQGLGHLGTLFSSSLDPDCAPSGVVLLRTMLGGSRAPRVHESTPQEIQQLVKEEVHPLLGISAEPLFSQSTHHRQALPRYDLQHLPRLEALEAALPPGLQLLGNHLHGIGIPALVRQARDLADSHLLAK